MGAYNGRRPCAQILRAKSTLRRPRAREFMKKIRCKAAGFFMNEPKDRGFSREHPLENLTHFDEFDGED